MTDHEAYETATTLIKIEDLRGAKLGQLVDATFTLAESNWVQYRSVAKRILRQFPALHDYDSKGNYVGHVANENGWTA
jgi:hypothetical protein